MNCNKFILVLVYILLIIGKLIGQSLASVNRPEIIGDHFDTIRYINSNAKEDFHLIKTTLYKRVEKMPVFAGCETDLDPEECSKKRLIDLLYNHIKYPVEAKKQRIQGVVYAKYVVRTDGSLTGIRIERGIGGGCDEEVIQFINQLPNYIPGYQDGKAVPVQVTLPVKFKLMK